MFSDPDEIFSQLEICCKTNKVSCLLPVWQLFCDQRNGTHTCFNRFVPDVVSAASLCAAILSQWLGRLQMMLAARHV